MRALRRGAAAARATAAFRSLVANEVSLASTTTVRMLGHDQLDPIFLATVQAVEESIVNALIAARAMTGVSGFHAPAIDHEALRALLRQHGRLRAARSP